MEEDILEYLQRPGYKPVKPAALAKQLKISKSRLGQFEDALQQLIDAGRVRKTRNGVLRPLSASDFLVGVVRRSSKGGGTFLPHEPPPWLKQPELRISARDMHDAHTGDEVLVRVISRRAAGGQRCGRVEEILERATRTFVGTYFERDGRSFVQVDGTAFPDPILVGDPGAKGARPNDKVVIEMLRFPTATLPGEAVLTEVLGERGQPGVDTIAVIHEFGLPHEFSDDVLNDARDVTAAFDPGELADRHDLTRDIIVTIDPADARDFDDAISLRKSRNGHWHLGVHIADVSHFVTPGTALDDEAKNRGTSVYLPDRVIPMLPELISNGLASLQQGEVRFTKSVLIEFAPDGIPVHADFCNSAIKVTKRFAYRDVLPIIQEPDRFKAKVSAKVRGLLLRMHELAMILRKRRFAAGSLELDLPEVKLDLDKDGRVSGAHEAEHDESHQIIEEFMLAANRAVAEELSGRSIPFMRRVHADPAERKLRAFAEFVRALGLDLRQPQSRAELQKLVREARGKPIEHAVNYALLRSMKQAEYTIAEYGHYALAFEDYCHFTSPIRRYPDLTVHRLFNDIFAGKKRPGHDEVTTERLAKHCSFTERRAADAERTLTQIKLLSFMSDRIGEQLDAVITGVESYGVFCRGVELPVEGLLHVTALDQGDYFEYDRSQMTLTGRRRGKRYRLGDPIRVEVAHVDVNRRQLDFRLAPTTGQASNARGNRTQQKGKKPTKRQTKRRQAGKRTRGRPR